MKQVLNWYILCQVSNDKKVLNCAIYFRLYLSHKITFLSKKEIRNHYYALITMIIAFIDAHRFI